MKRLLMLVALFAAVSVEASNMGGACLNGFTRRSTGRNSYTCSGTQKYATMPVCLPNYRAQKRVQKGSKVTYTCQNCKPGYSLQPVGNARKMGCIKNGLVG